MIAPFSDSTNPSFNFPLLSISLLLQSSQSSVAFLPLSVHHLLVSQLPQPIIHLLCLPTPSTHHLSGASVFQLPKTIILHLTSVSQIPQYLSVNFSISLQLPQNIIDLLCHLSPNSHNPSFNFSILLITSASFIIFCICLPVPSTHHSSSISHPCLQYLIKTISI